MITTQQDTIRFIDEAINRLKPEQQIAIRDYVMSDRPLLIKARTMVTKLIQLGWSEKTRLSVKPKNEERVLAPDLNKLVMSALVALKDQIQTMGIRRASDLDV